MFIPASFWFDLGMSKAKASLTKKLKKLKRLKKRHAELEDRLAREVARRKKWKARAKELEAALDALQGDGDDVAEDADSMVETESAESAGEPGEPRPDEAALAAEPDESWTLEELRSLSERRHVEGYATMDKETLLITVL